MKQSRELLEQNLIKPTLEVKKRRGVVKDIKTHLSEKHDIFDGTIQTWINNPAEELKSIDPRLLFLFSEQVYQKTGDLNINPEEFYTESEIKTSRQYSGKMFLKDELKFPLVFEHALESSRDSWIVMIDIKTIAALLQSRKLHWNPEAQREATIKEINGDIIETATVYMHNVLEMKQLLKENKLERTQLIFNASLGTSDDNGDEVVYDKETNVDIIIDDLQHKSVLRDRISKKEGLRGKDIVTYHTLVSSIEKNFELSRKLDQVETSNYLKDFFEMMFEYYHDEFTTNYNETKKTSLLTDNNMFAGFVLLAARMKSNDIDASIVYKYMKNIDFNKSNPLWKELDVLDDKGRLTRNAKQGIEKYFSNIEL